MFSRLFVLIFILSCSSTKPTPYQKEKKKEGYRDTTFQDLRVTTFKGNSHTKKDRAQIFAEFRAIERCFEEKKHANIIDIFDKTVEKEVIRSSGSGWGPSTYFGMYPYYSRYSSFGIGGGYNTMSINSWNEILIYPIIQLYYTCADVIVRPKVIFKELSAEQIKHLVKDVKGAIQVEKIEDTSPNKGALELGDIILKANGKRIEKVYELIRLFNTSATEVSVQLLREGDKEVSKLKGQDVTQEVDKSEKNIIKKVCYDDKDKESKIKSRPICQ